MLCVCDREADMFELFDVQRRRPRVELLVRAKHDRVLAKGKPKLFATMSGGEPDGLIDVEIEGLTARPKSSRKKARPARKKRWQAASCGSAASRCRRRTPSRAQTRWLCTGFTSRRPRRPRTRNPCSGSC